MKQGWFGVIGKGVVPLRVAYVQMPNYGIPFVHDIFYKNFKILMVILLYNKTMKTEQLDNNRRVQFPEHLKELEKTPYTRVFEEISFNSEAIEILQEGEADFFISSPDDMTNQLNEFLVTIGNNDQEGIDQLSGSIQGAVVSMMKDFGAEAAHVIVRVKLPTEEFSLPRWHRDGSFFVRENGNKIFKKVLTLKGVPTRFATISDEEAFQEIERAELKNNTKLFEGSISDEDYKKEDIRIRNLYVNIANELSPLASGQSMVYEIGGNEQVLHSEPDINESRIFMSVIVGSKDEIEEAELSTK